MELLGIKLSSQQWIANVNSFYYHDIQPQPLLLNLKEGWKFNLHPKSIMIIYIIKIKLLFGNC